MAYLQTRIQENIVDGVHVEPYWLVQARANDDAPWVTTSDSCNSKVAAAGRASVLAKRDFEIIENHD